MNSSSILLDIPPEIRNVIYEHAFRLSSPIRLRTPSRRRLRPSRIEKEDPRSLLETCQLIRNEAVPIFYSQNPLAFRCDRDALEFVHDKRLHPAILSSVTHLAVDDGDVCNGSGTAQAQFEVTSDCLAALSKLRTLEFRFYARTDDMHCRLGFGTVSRYWSHLAGSMNDTVSEDGGDDDPPYILWLETFNREPLNKALDAIRDRGFKITQTQTKEQYGFEKENTTTDLTCCNLILDKDGSSVPALGAAKAAVQERMARVGARPKKLRDMYDTQRYEI